MWRSFRIFVWGGLFGAIFGLALGLFLFPYLFPPPEAMEQLTAAERTKLVAKGNFIHADPNDPIHWGKGQVSVYQGTVFLHDDFEVGPGPKFHVYLVPKANVRSASDVTGTMFVDLGRLRAFKGSQKYPVPAGVDLTKFPSVVIWCEQFSVLISPADLTFEPVSGEVQ
ncbi:MAG: DM13 domain-containing protein [Alphaproteobacteria bacterium]|nr:DM13 domain-containing protein [Alphaproteobacteria bacterium]